MTRTRIMALGLLLVPVCAGAAGSGGPAPRRLTAGELDGTYAAYLCCDPTGGSACAAVGGNCNTVASTAGLPANTLQDTFYKGNPYLDCANAGAQCKWAPTGTDDADCEWTPRNKCCLYLPTRTNCAQYRSGTCKQKSRWVVHGIYLVYDVYVLRWCACEGNMVTQEWTMTRRQCNGDPCWF